MPEPEVRTGRSINLPFRLSIVCLLCGLSALCIVAGVAALFGLQENFFPSRMLTVDPLVVQAGHIEVDKGTEVAFTFRNHAKRSFQIIGNDGA